MTKYEIITALPNLRMVELAEIIKQAQGLRRADKFRKDMHLRGKRDQFWEEVRRNLGIQFATSSASHNRWSFSWKTERFGITLGEDSLNISLYGTNLKKRIKRNKLGSINLPVVLNTLISMSQTKMVLET